MVLSPKRSGISCLQSRLFCSPKRLATYHFKYEWFRPQNVRGHLTYNLACFVPETFWRHTTLNMSGFVPKTFEDILLTTSLVLSPKHFGFRRYYLLYNLTGFVSKTCLQNVWGRVTSNLTGFVPKEGGTAVLLRGGP